MISPTAMTDRSQRLGAMMIQENSSYKCEDYLDSKGNTNSFAMSLPSSSTSSSQMDESWRSNICEWCFQIVDHFDFSREVVSIAMSYLDRYVAAKMRQSEESVKDGQRPPQLISETTYRLAAMSALHLSIKLYEYQKLKMTHLVHLSRGYFTEEHIAAMEQDLLVTLQWRLHPPMPMDFVRDVLPLSSDMDPQYRPNSAALTSITELTRFLTELSVCDYYFVTKKPSSIAIAALILALEASFELTGNDPVSSKNQQIIVDGIKTNLFQIILNAGIEISKEDEDSIECCLVRLKEMYAAAAVSFPPNFEDETNGEDDDQNGLTRPRNGNVSPTSVFDAV